jgi:hypothetical protein
MLANSAAIASLGLLAMPVVPALSGEEEIGEFDFFDYLGAMVEQDGEWSDPVALAEAMDEHPGNDAEDARVPADTDSAVNDSATSEDSR